MELQALKAQQARLDLKDLWVQQVHKEILAARPEPLAKLERLAPRGDLPARLEPLVTPE
jgi:hypothetical protein